MRYLEGDVIDAEVSELDGLRLEVAQLRQELAGARSAAIAAGSAAVKSTANLRRQLTPLYRALQAVFGELDAIGGAEATESATDPRWLSWKQKLPGRPAEMIDLLLLHGEMNRNQLMAGMRAGKDVVRVTISKLNTAGLLVKNGGRVSLKKL